jgi:butyryl-CoA dehydrogenase
MCLDVSLTAIQNKAPAADSVRLGSIAACQYFYRYELPKIGAWLAVVSRRDDTCTAIPESAF